MTYDSIILYAQEKNRVLMVKVAHGAVPRPKPEPENEKVRTTVSLPRKVVELANGYLFLNPQENLPDFSALTARALIDYASRKHPDLLRECVQRIREQAAAKRKSGGRKNEGQQDTYGLPAPKPPHQIQWKKKGA